MMLSGQLLATSGTIKAFPYNGGFLSGNLNTAYTAYKSPRETELETEIASLKAEVKQLRDIIES